MALGAGAYLPPVIATVLGEMGSVTTEMGKVKTGLAALDAQLGDKPWCAGNGYTLADIAVGVCLGWLEFRHPKLDWKTDHANLARAFAKLSERQSFIDTVPRE
jgi:glutathione S-transferase